MTQGWERKVFKNHKLRGIYQSIIIINNRGFQGQCKISLTKNNNCHNSWQQFAISWSAGIYMLKVNNRNARTSCEIWSKLTVVNFEHISQLVLVFLLLTLNMYITMLEKTIGTK